MISVLVVASGEGLVPPMTSVKVAASLGVADAVEAGTPGVGAGVGVAVAVRAGAGPAGVPAVAEGVGEGSAQAGELAAAGIARERISAAIHAVLFFVEFTVRLS